MSVILKRIERWKRGKQPVPIDEVMTVLIRFFSRDDITWRGSHIRIHDERLNHCIECGEDGVFQIPVMSGQHVKIYYVKYLLIPVLDFLGCIDEERKRNIET